MHDKHNDLKTTLPGIICQLDEATINKIAAGEVVESPSSVLKELIENSVDAGATHIRIEAKAGGFQSLTVHDNGKGMASEQLSLAVLRHATSKIRVIDDMSVLQTMGFRGEALASISAVSKFKIKSCLQDIKEGAELTVEGGICGSVCACARSPGTSIDVADLFYNVPARRKFQKSVRASTMSLQKCVFSMATAYPSISFTYHYNNQQVIDVARVPEGFATQEGLSDLLQRLTILYGTQTFDGAVPFSIGVDALGAERAGLTRLYGFLCSSEQSSAQRRGQHMIVNERYVFSPLIAKAVESGYGHLLPQGRRAQFFLYLDIDPEYLDVNVHPQKSQVRFAQESVLYRKVYVSVSNVLQAGTWQSARDVTLDAFAQPSVFSDPNSLGRDMQVTPAGFEQKAQDLSSKGKESTFKHAAQDSVEFSIQELPDWLRSTSTTSRTDAILHGDFGTSSTDAMGERRPQGANKGHFVDQGLDATWPTSGDLQGGSSVGNSLAESINASQQQNDLFSKEKVFPLFTWKQWAVWDLESLPKEYAAIFAQCARLKGQFRKVEHSGNTQQREGLLFLYVRRAKARLFYDQKAMELFSKGSEGHINEMGEFSEQLLIPYTLSFAPEDLARLLNLSNSLEKLGVSISALSERELAVHSVVLGASEEMMVSFFEHLLQSLHLYFTTNDAIDDIKELGSNRAMTAAVQASLLKISLLELAKSVEMRQYSVSKDECAELLFETVKSYHNMQQYSAHYRSQKVESAECFLEDMPHSGQKILPWGSSPLGKEIAAIWSYKEIMEHFTKRFFREGRGG